jgi:cyanophycinase
VKKVTIIASSQKTLPKDVDAIYLTGGYDSRLMRLLEQDLKEQLTSYYEAGGLVGGTSAGAMVMGAKMILGGMNDGILRPKALRISNGLNLLSKAIIDTHVKERQRFDRLMEAVAMCDGLTGIGLDEDTAIHVENHRASVYGKGHARIYRRGPDFSSDLKTINQFGTAGVSNVLVSCLASGQTFDI